MNPEIEQLEAAIAAANEKLAELKAAEAAIETIGAERLMLLLED